jgi:hypothetical protein
MKRRNIMLRLILLLGLSLILMTWLFRGNPPQGNLIENPGFEEGTEDQAAVWLTAGDVAWVTDEVHSGERAMRITATGRSARIISNWFQAPPHSRVEVSAWLRAEDVAQMGPFQKLRVTIQAFAADQNTRITHFDLVSTHGSFPWKQIRSSIIVPEGTAYLRLEFQLTETTGTIWVDDVEAYIVQTVPEFDPAEIEPPVLLPEPWQVVGSRERVQLNTITILGCETGQRFTAALEAFLSEAGIPYQCAGEECQYPEGGSFLVVGGECNPFFTRQLANRFPDVTLEDLGDQGYFLSVDTEAGYPLIFLAGNTERARYYGLQTLKQLIDRQTGTIAQVDIVDRPSLDLRGIIMGVQWFNAQDEAFRRISELKLNFIWNQGSFLNEKFWFRWREPLSEREQNDLIQYFRRAHRNFVDPFISIAPRGRDASNPTIYSSDEEIDLVVAKMNTLYELGLRNFGLSFDDLANFGQGQLSGPDVEFFNNDMGEAHLYFIEQVYRRLQANHPDITFAVVPMIYSGFNSLGDADLAYLETLGRLPPEIMLYTSPEYNEEAELARDLTGRPHLVWDNFYAHFYQTPAPEYVIPLDRPAGFDQTRVAGYTFLPLIPATEDAALITWRTAANYAWAPERHNPQRAFQLAAAKYMNWVDVVDGGERE